MEGPSIVMVSGAVDSAMMAELDRSTRDWEMRAARGECAWICVDCCLSYPNGMPDKCGYGQQSCTELIIRDKKEAMK